MKPPLKDEAPRGIARRGFLVAFAAGFAAPLLLSLLNRFSGRLSRKKSVRPPGALAEADFLDACIGCGQCANVCPNKCISLTGLDDGLAGLATPQIIPRAKGCILCMACTQVCPTRALTPLEPTEEGRLAVRMGTAVLSEEICYSYAGRTCGACYRACPLPGKAMTIGLFEQPTVHPDFCVGCGLCEQACVHMPQAIRIIPARDLAARGDPRHG
jgi:MauM/NapG family ferredoxin protein